MKKCPYCAEEIQDEAIKCRYCGEFLEGASPSLISVDDPDSSTPISATEGPTTVSPEWHAYVIDYHNKSPSAQEYARSALKPEQIRELDAALKAIGGQQSTSSEALYEEPLDVIEDPPRKSAAVSGGFLKLLGVVLFLGGVAAAVYFYAYFDTSVATPVLEILGQRVGGDRVHNIGLMQDRQNGLIVSVAAVLVGLGCVVLGQRQFSAGKRK